MSEQQIRLTSYGDCIIRIQPVRKGEDFFPDDYYEMLEPKKWNGNLSVADNGEFLLVERNSSRGFKIKIKKDPVRFEFYRKDDSSILLAEKDGIVWQDHKVYVSFIFDDKENFTGLGHSYLGRSKKINLKGEFIGRNYGRKPGEQAPLIVPFYLSCKGYGIFLNTTFENFFNMGKNRVYEFGFDDHGFKSRMDYFFIFGPEFPEILNLYTRLTGRPRLPMKAVFGLGLSDKGNPLDSENPSSEKWWKEKITSHRNAGFPIDHVINDNVWRAGGGERCNSYFDWDKERYPDPREYKRWLSANGLITTLDFNRCISSKSEGWENSYNIPDNSGIEFKESAPDLTRKEVRQWWWNLFWKKALDPDLNFPGDALWIDEFDEMGNAKDSMILGNGRSWAEMKNYWFMLSAKALVEEGWDKSTIRKRPFVWVRGMTAGAQRYATLWSGDISCTYEDMHAQIISLQLAGLSGFPYWGHDAGGFHDHEGAGPNKNMYRQWSMAFGSFTPYWRPHGTGESRWPLDRSLEEQRDAKVYCRLRYEMMPYIYTYAYQSYETGMPMARAMVIYYQNDSSAWKYDSQYFWGDQILAAPLAGDSGYVSVWLPEGKYYDFWNDELYGGNGVIKYFASTGKMPLFVKEGSIIPMCDFALSTSFINQNKLNIHIYTGKDGSFTLYEDDGVTELYRTRNQKRFTRINYSDSEKIFIINEPEGSYENAPEERTYRIIFHGLAGKYTAEIQGREIPISGSKKEAEDQEGCFIDTNNRTLSIFKTHPVHKKLTIKLVPNE
jgi:alpha-D-xyloside xylohydrolase